jgi:hypothetical protein
MELDEIKKNWKEMDELKEKLQISDNRIKEMLKKEGKSALDIIIKTAKIYTIIIIPLGFILCLLSYSFFEAGGLYIICPLSFLLLCLIMEPLEIYLYKLLKGIDYSNMPVKVVSERILKYQDIIQKSQMYGTIVFFVYLGIWYYLYYKLIFGAEIVWVYIIFVTTIYLTMGLIGIPVLYKKLYYNNINRIKKNLEELKEFEES